MTRRNIELLLLVLAAPIVILIYAMIILNQGQSLGVNTLGVPLGIFAAFGAAHFAVRKWAPSADPALLPITFALSGIGIAFVTRLAPNLALRQFAWLLASIAAMVAILALVRNLDKLSKYKYTLMVAGFILLLSPMLPFIGTEIYGSRIWLSFGPFSFQPGEIAKIMIVLFLASYLAVNREMLSVYTKKIGPFWVPDLRTLMPLMIMWVISLIIVIFEKDLGSALVVFSVFVTMLYVASGKKPYVFAALTLAAIGAVLMWAIFSHVQVRVDTWLNPFADPTGVGYQLCQAVFSMADGNLFGTGIGRGLCDQIPIVESDYIFAAIAEETGLLGASGVLLLFLAFAVRGIVTAARAKSDVSSFIAIGLTAAIVLQAFIIVGGVTRLIPLTGLTLPFVSQGGSSLLASFIAVGFLLRCGDEGTGIESEISTTGIMRPVHEDMGVLGRVALGKRLTGFMIVVAILFAALVANLTLLMVVNAEKYRSMEENNHTIAQQAQHERGTISTSDGVILATSVFNEETREYDRQYPAGDLATHVVGYASPIYGASGIEATYNDTLKGSENYATWTDVLNDYAGLSTAGNDVTLTINSTVQQAAQDALYGVNGACIVIDPETGAILALASSPTYDASNFASIIEGEGENDALFNRATQALYAPGSTFKMLTLATALENGVASEDTTYDAPGTLDIGNAPVYNFDKNDLGEITLEEATWYSSNTVFGQLGVQIGAGLLVKYATMCGFNDKVPFDLPLEMSLMPNPKEMTEWETAWAAIGQPVGEHKSPAGPQATVLQMSMIGCAIANDGQIATPYLVEGIYNANGERAMSAHTTTYSTVMSADTAKRVRTVLEGVINTGTGTAAAIEGVQIAGKTGTAEGGRQVDDSWFVGMGPSDDCKVVIAIILEEGANNYDDAAARAKNVLSVALQAQGAL